MTQIIGILNITPDSFSDGGLYDDFDDAIARAEKMFADGAAFVDIGAESTRPGAQQLTPAEEWHRLSPILSYLLKKYPGKISVDTYHPETAAMALGLGDVIINDVTGMNNPGMIEAITSHKARCIISHLPGADIQKAHKEAPVSAVGQVKNDLLAKAALLESKGVPRKNIWLDPGIGFGKTMELNKQLLGFAKELAGYKVVIGYSRKRFLGDERMELAPNLEAGKLVIASGADYIRVHDVSGHQQLL